MVFDAWFSLGEDLFLDWRTRVHLLSFNLCFYVIKIEMKKIILKFKNTFCIISKQQF